MRVVINAVVIENGNILLVRKKLTWILPGGKPVPGESDIECVIRESKEELDGTELENILFYKSIMGRAPHKGDEIEARVYFANIKGSLKGYSGEISAAEFAKDLHNYRLSNTTSKVIESLKHDKYL